MSKQQLQVGSSVVVPWGLERDVEGVVVEVWGNPPAHIRVRLRFEEDDEEAEPVVLLLSPSSVTAA